MKSYLSYAICFTTICTMHIFFQQSQHSAVCKTYSDNTTFTLQNLPWPSAQAALCTTSPESVHILRFARFTPINISCTLQNLPWPSAHDALCTTSSDSGHILHNTPEGIHILHFVRFTLINISCTLQNLPWPSAHPALCKVYPDQQILHSIKLTLTSSTSCALQRSMTTFSSSWYSPCQK